MDLKTKTLRAGWALLGGGIVRQLIQLLLGLLLARMLGVTEYGLLSLGLAITALFGSLSEFGISIALVRIKEFSQSWIDSAFTLTIGFSSLLGLACYLSGFLFAGFYNLPSLVPLMSLLSIGLFLSGASSIFNSLLQRDFKFKELAILQLASPSCTLTVSFILLWLGFGTESYGIGFIAGSLASYLLGFLYTGAIPRGFGNLQEIKTLLSFGAWVSGGRALSITGGNIDQLVLGKLLDVASIGWYAMAQRIILIFPSLISSILEQVLYPIYSGWQDDSRRIAQTYWKVVTFMVIVTTPLAFLLYMVAEPMVLLVLGSDWRSLVLILKIMCIFGIFQTLGGGIFGSLLYAQNLPNVLVIMGVFRSVVLPIFVSIGAILGGIIGATWGFAIFAIVGRLFNQYLLEKYLNLKIKDLVRYTILPLTANIIASLAVELALNTWSISQSHLVQIVLISISWLLAYYFSLKIIAPGELKYSFDILFSFIKPSSATNNFKSS